VLASAVFGHRQQRDQPLAPAQSAQYSTGAHIDGVGEAVDDRREYSSGCIFDWWTARPIVNAQAE
jgi:hypothetical protein